MGFLLHLLIHVLINQEMKLIFRIHRGAILSGLQYSTTVHSAMNTDLSPKNWMSLLHNWVIIDA